MSKTLIDGTEYTIKGGKTLIDGTAYNIAKGRTLINNVGYDILFGDEEGLSLSELSLGELQQLFYEGIVNKNYPFDLKVDKKTSIDIPLALSNTSNTSTPTYNANFVSLDGKTSAKITIVYKNEDENYDWKYALMVTNGTTISNSTASNLAVQSLIGGWGASGSLYLYKMRYGFLDATGIDLDFITPEENKARNINRYNMSFRGANTSGTFEQKSETLTTSYNTTITRSNDEEIVISNIKSFSNTRLPRALEISPNSTLANSTIDTGSYFIFKYIPNLEYSSAYGLATSDYSTNTREIVYYNENTLLKQNNYNTYLYVAPIFFI